MAAPANDNFANRQVITGSTGSVGPLTIDDATTEASEPRGVHISGGIHQSVWYEWTAPADGVITITTLDGLATDSHGDPSGRLDTTLTVWLGTSLLTLTEVVSDDDVDGTNYSSAVTFIAIAGSVYKIQVGTFGSGYTGTLKLNWSFNTVRLTVTNKKVLAAVEISGTETLPRWSNTLLPAPGFSDTFAATDSATVGSYVIAVVASQYPINTTTGLQQDRLNLDEIGIAAFSGLHHPYAFQLIGLYENTQGAGMTPFIQGVQIQLLTNPISVGDTFIANWSSSDTVDGASVGGRTYLVISFDISPAFLDMDVDGGHWGSGNTQDMLNDGENDEAVSTGTAISATLPNGDRRITRPDSTVGYQPKNGALIAIAAWENGLHTIGSVDTKYTELGKTPSAAGRFGIALYARPFPPSDTEDYSFSATLSAIDTWRVIMSSWAIGPFSSTPVLQSIFWFFKDGVWHNQNVDTNYSLYQFKDGAWRQDGVDTSYALTGQLEGTWQT